jgi:hypothetical protein
LSFTFIWLSGIADRQQLKNDERGARGDRRDRADMGLQRRELAAQKTQEGNLMMISNAIHNCLQRVRDKCQTLQQCPCCRSKFVEKEKDAMIMTCYECETEWGRRTCGKCHKDYAFIVPHDKDANLPPGVFDPLRVFGADMCATILPASSAPFLARSTECPYCGPTFTNREAID